MAEVASEAAAPLEQPEQQEDTQPQPQQQAPPVEYRYVRVNPRAAAHLVDDAAALAAALAVEPACVTRVPWAPGFFRVPGSLALASSACFRAAHVYGIDASSAAPVLALSLEPGQHVLDLCAAPGGKLAMIADAVTAHSSGKRARGSVTGVDVSLPRMHTCRALCRKYAVPNVRLYCGDGQTFDVPAPRWHDDPSIRPGAARKSRVRRDARRVAASGAAFAAANEHVLVHAAPGTLRADAPSSGEHDDSAIPDLAAAPAAAYDAVLVDVQCTHDASTRHLAKWAVSAAEARDTADASLHSLQRALLANALQHVRPGGIVVYSTCSASQAQNDDVVTWALQHAGVRVACEPVPGADAMPAQPGVAPHSLVFDPARSQCSGQYIARMRRAA